MICVSCNIYEFGNLDLLILRYLIKQLIALAILSSDFNMSLPCAGHKTYFVGQHLFSYRLVISENY